jgi:high affinity choline transporter 7
LLYEDRAFVLPLAMQYLCPFWVTVIGLGGLLVAAMATADSAVLSAASVFGQNLYKTIIRPRVSNFISIVMLAIY